MTTLTAITGAHIAADDYAGMLPKTDHSFAAFYKIRSAIANTQNIDKTAIRPDSRLETFFPRKGRHQAVKAFQKALGIDVQLLVMKDSMEWAIILSAATTFISLFYTWKGALAWAAFTVLISWLAGKFGKELKLNSVQELSEKIARDHYIQASHHPAHLNKEQTAQLLEQLLVTDAHFEPAVLIHDAPCW